jgi:putative endopeptidase
LAHLDPAVRPQDDLFGHVNGRWLTDYVMPADRATDGAFRQLYDRAEEQVHEIITQAAEAVGAEGSDEQRIGDLYASFLDEQAVERRGLGPLLEEMALIDHAPDLQALAVTLGRFQRTGVGGGVGLYVNTDSKDSSRYLMHVSQSGLGLPDESYYRDDQHAAILGAYPAHIAAMFARVFGGTADAYVQRAGRIVALETKLAAEHWDVVRRRDADLSYNLRTFAELPDWAPGFDWFGWIVAMGAAPEAVSEVIVRQPDYLTAFAELWSSQDFADWQDWARWRRSGGGGVRLLRPYPDRYGADPGTVEAGRLPGGEPDGRRGRPTLCRTPFSPAGQGPDGRLGGQPARGLPGQHQRPGVDDPGHP